MTGERAAPCHQAKDSASWNITITMSDMCHHAVAAERPAAVRAEYTCPMHREIRQHAPGPCALRRSPVR
jgi:hypothetical protein